MALAIGKSNCGFIGYVIFLAFKTTIFYYEIPYISFYFYFFFHLELKRRLDDNDSPLCKRIRMAEDIFKSNNFPLTSHRNITLNWLCNLADNSTDDFSWIESIKKCFGTSFAYADLDNSLIENLIKVFILKFVLL